MRRISHQTSHYRLLGWFKSLVLLSTILSVIIVLFIFTFFRQLGALNTKEEPEASVLPYHQDDFDNIDQNSLIPPVNVSAKERIAWFRSKLPEFNMIFRSDNLTRRFHSRVLELFNQECEVQIFMTWIAPARSFGRRAMLAIESVFKAHPDGCLMILSRSMDTIIGYKKLKPLLDRGFRVVAVAPDLSFLFKNTPAKSWFDEMKTGKKDPGEIRLTQNLSNLIRLAVLYKYGGIYMDVDFIVLKSFKRLKNCIGAQSIYEESKKWRVLNNAVLIFDKNHPLLFKFIEDFALNFNGSIWGHNGPYLLSRVLRKVEGMFTYNVNILPDVSFYPVDWHNIGGLFKKPQSQLESKEVEDKLLLLNEKSYGIHLWNQFSSKLTIEEGSVMGRLISDHCVICQNIYTS